jgi:hypothetical protein
MRIFRSAMIVPAMILAFGLSAPAQDHLEPEDGVLNQPDWSWDYSKKLREVLLKDAASYHLARMVCLPAFEPEWAVTVVREKVKDFDDPHTYFVEYAGAEKKLSRKDAPNARVTKARAPLDGDTAESLNRTWRRMLRTIRYPEELGIGADGVDYHFSRFVPLFDRGQNDPLAGWEQGKIWTPDEESPCGELVAIGEALRAYALARPEGRDEARSVIRAKVDRLKATLDRLDRKKRAGAAAG